VVIADAALQKRLPVFDHIGSVQIGGLKGTIHKGICSIGVGDILVALWMVIVMRWTT